MKLGTIALAIFLILFGLVSFGLPIPAVIVGIVAVLAGILILVDK
jgi:hypothetical protein